MSYSGPRTMHWTDSEHRPPGGPRGAVSCGRVLRGTRGITSLVTRVSCKSCMASPAYKSASTERRLGSITCPGCAGSGIGLTPAAPCMICYGAGRVLPCTWCTGPNPRQPNHLACSACEGRQYTAL